MASISRRHHRASNISQSVMRNMRDCLYDFKSLCGAWGLALRWVRSTVRTPLLVHRNPSRERILAIIKNTCSLLK